MRIKFAKFIALFIVVFNVLVVYYTLKLFLSFNSIDTPSKVVQKTKLSAKPPTKHIGKLVTIIIRKFELYENDVTLTVKSFLNVFPNIQVLVLSDGLPYPPLELSFWNATIKNVKIINLTPNLNYAYIEQYPLVYVKTKYVLFVPDSTRLVNRQILQLMLVELLKKPESIIVAPFNLKDSLNCLQVNLSIREWTVKYEALDSQICDAVTGKHVIMLETDVLKRLSNGFLLPFPQSLYLQTSVLTIKVR